MTFEEFFSDAIGRGMDAAHRPAMLCAWDAALCAATQACRVKGKLKEPLAMAAAISDLHSWVRPLDPATLAAGPQRPFKNSL